MFKKTGLIFLIILCCLIEAVLLISDLGWRGTVRLRSLAYEYAGFWPGLLGSWKPNYPAQPYIMFLSYGFLHGGIIHLGGNMFTLWQLGRPVLSRVGARFCPALSGRAIGWGFGLLASDLPPMVVASGA